MKCSGGVGYSGCSAHGSLYCRLIGMLLALDMQSRVKDNSVEPVVAVVSLRGILMQGDAVNSGQQFPVQCAHMLVMGYVVSGNGHLAAAYTRADIGHTVIVSDALVLIVGISLAGLGGVEHNLGLALLVRADKRASARGGYHLVAVERQYSVPAECSEHPPVEPGTETLCGILDDGEDSVFFEDNKFNKLMETVEEVIVEPAPTTENVAEEESEETITLASVTGEQEDREDNQLAFSFEEEREDLSASEDTSEPRVRQTEPISENPQKLVEQGFSFLSGLADTLSSPEKTARLVDALVKEDKETGKATIEIPVADKESVTKMFQLFGKLINLGR